MRKIDSAGETKRATGSSELGTRLAALLLCSMGAVTLGSTAAAQQQEGPQSAGQQAPQQPATQQAPQQPGAQEAPQEPTAQQAPQEPTAQQAPQQRAADETEREAADESFGGELETQERELEAQQREQQELEAELRELDVQRRELEAAQRQLEAAERQREAVQRQREAAERQREAAQRQVEAAQRELEAAQRQRVREREATQRTAQREREALQESELEATRRELEAARRNLEQAAREVARLSAEAVTPFVTDLRRQWLGTGQRATLGIVIVDTEEGASVSAVSPGGPAEEAGVRVGDVIVAIDGRSLTEADASPSRVLINRLSEIEPGTPVELSMRSDGDGQRVVRVTTRERESQVAAREGPSFSFEPLQELFLSLSNDRWSSMELVSLTPELGTYFGTDHGLLVVRAPDDESLMLEDGDVILAISGREPSSPEHAMRILGTFEPGETVELTIMRARQQQTLEIPLTDGETASGEAAGEAA